MLRLRAAVPHILKAVGFISTGKARNHLSPGPGDMTPNHPGDTNRLASRSSI
jgi:hypothetical protein